jgi:hypothetical protein
MADRKERCETCKWWEHKPGWDGGRCHRNAPFVPWPSPQGVDITSMTIWPCVDADDWCGEWKSLNPESHQDYRPLSCLRLSVRAVNCLESEEIFTVGQLCQKTARELLEFRNLGEVTLHEIMESLETKGMHLRGATPKSSDSD